VKMKCASCATVAHRHRLCAARNRAGQKKESVWDTAWDFSERYVKRILLPLLADLR
jgi:hypothetical protein